MSDPLPTTMTAIEIKAPGGPEVLVPGSRPTPQAGAGRGAGQGRGGRRQPPRRPAAQGRPIRRRRAHPTFPASRSPARWSALGEGAPRWRWATASARLVAGRRLRAILPASTRRNALPMPAGFDWSRRPRMPETFFTVWTNVFERGAAEGRRDASWSTAAPPASAPRRSCWPRRSARRVHRRRPGSAEKCAACLQARRRPRVQLPQRGLRRGGEGTRPAGAASTSSSTWSAATTSPATTRPRPSMAGSCRSPSCRAPRPEVDFRR